CLVSAIEQSPCSITNQTCVCTNAPLQADVTVCVTQNCTVKESLVTKNATNTACGVPIRDRSQTYNITSITLGVISGFLILLRLGFKLLVTTTGLTLDDWFILLTILSGVPSSVIVSYGTVPNGLGRDVWTLTPTKITNFGLFFHTMAVLYFAQVMLLKLSLLFFYLRIFPERKVRHLLLGTAAFNTLVGIVFIFLAIFQCHPISYFWTKWDGEHTGTCMDINAIGWANAIISIALDLCMLAIPMWQVKNLHLNWKKKIGVGIMFATGAFVTVVSVIRLSSLVTFAKSDNPTWDNYDVSIWSSVEINVGIICACMPTLRLLLVRVFPVFGSTRSGGAYYNYSGNGSKSNPKSKMRSTSRVVGDSSVVTADGRGALYKNEHADHFREADSSQVELRDVSFRPQTTSDNVSKAST
ncbi:hypothetical protein M406DRAFT_51480, partial [Cryphonectria parasitica EP155]